MTAPGRGPALVRAGWKDGPVRGAGFPWHVPAVRAPVTFFFLAAPGRFLKRLA